MEFDFLFPLFYIVLIYFTLSYYFIPFHQSYSNRPRMTQIFSNTNSTYLATGTDTHFLGLLYLYKMWIISCLYNTIPPKKLFWVEHLFWDRKEKWPLRYYLILSYFFRLMMQSSIVYKKYSFFDAFLVFPVQQMLFAT